jgi:integrase
VSSGRHGSTPPIAARKRLENPGLLQVLHAVRLDSDEPGHARRTAESATFADPALQADQVAAILAAAGTFWDRGIFGRDNRERIRALVLLPRGSGLRIMDAVCLEKSRIVGDRLFLYTGKTGTPVRLPLPPEVIQALGDVPNANADYFFWNGRSLRTSAVKIRERTLSRCSRWLESRTAMRTGFVTRSRSSSCWPTSRSIRSRFS